MRYVPPKKLPPDLSSLSVINTDISGSNPKNEKKSLYHQGSIKYILFLVVAAVVVVVVVEQYSHSNL